MRRDLRFTVLIREDKRRHILLSYLKTLSVCWSGRSRTHDLPHGSPVLNQLSHRCAVVASLRMCCSFPTVPFK